ncbi:hypothetical protein E4656_00450 [Natronospirillum operosum]|uniref:Uncharacterized protein n=1 Tax=Natronospirillum operosum TaxID=2759953 RepID=A0A4Z0WGR1_9GAMM|nr:hypothetical protein [Natronospirillum operosum]TGG94936.1 hypothetical protein E4656_00450 [Natronospirillum operosum]
MTITSGISAYSALPTPQNGKQKDDPRQTPSFEAVSAALKPVPVARAVEQSEGKAAVQSLPTALYGPPPNVSSSQSAPPPADKVNGEEQKETSALQELRDFLEMSPAEQVRAGMLKEMGLTEEALDKLPADEREAIELKITQRIEDTLGKEATFMADKGSVAANVNLATGADQKGMDQAVRLSQAISMVSGFN